MSAILTADFGNFEAAKQAAAGNAAFARALDLGYCRVVAQQFARVAKREASAWESARETALRVVPTKRTTLGNHTNGPATA